ncbi:MAG: hypothetical protein J6Y02_18010 [Pseudobutyrivibrio sp.]|nr:hypothetical protein [Pseudobutyrivibrio sp.]
MSDTILNMAMEKLAESVFMNAARQKLDNMIKKDIIKPALRNVGLSGLGGASIGGLLGIGKTYFDQDEDNKATAGDYLKNSFIGAGLGGLAGSGISLFKEIPQAIRTKNNFKAWFDHLPHDSDHYIKYYYNADKQRDAYSVAADIFKELSPGMKEESKKNLKTVLSELDSKLDGKYTRYYQTFVGDGVVPQEIREQLRHLTLLDALSNSKKQSYRDLAAKFVNQDLTSPDFPLYGENGLSRMLDDVLAQEARKDLKNEYMYILHKRGLV